VIPITVDEIPVSFKLSETTIARIAEINEFINSGAEAAKVQRFSLRVNSDVDGYKMAIRKLNLKGYVICFSRHNEVFVQKKI